MELRSTREGVLFHVRDRVVVRLPSDEAGERTAAAVLFGAGGAEIPLELRLGPARRAGGPFVSRREVAFEVRVPIGHLELERLDGFRQADVELTFSSIDAAGDASPPTVIALQLRIPDADWERARTAVWPCVGQLRSRPGTHRYVVTLRDVRSERLGTAQASGTFD